MVRNVKLVIRNQNWQNDKNGYPCANQSREFQFPAFGYSFYSCGKITVDYSQWNDQDFYDHKIDEKENYIDREEKKILPAQWS
jgi:hypothetical protein